MGFKQTDLDSSAEHILEITAFPSCILLNGPNQILYMGDFTQGGNWLLLNWRIFDLEWSL